MLAAVFQKRSGESSAPTDLNGPRSCQKVLKVVGL
jgi:hypothetical protein